MATSGSYRRLLKLLERWPVDDSKSGRDLGTFLRDSIGRAQQDGKLTDSAQYWDRQYIAINRILNNEHCKKYTRTLASSATGLNAEQCSLALSTDYLQHLAAEDKSIFSRLRFRWK